MKTVTSGAHYTTVTVDTAEAVKFSFPSTSLSVEAAGGDITVALTDTAQVGDDETITVPDGESRMFIHHRMNVDTYYLTGSGTAKLYASNMGDVNPFKGKSKGGDGGGDNIHYYTTMPTITAAMLGQIAMYVGATGNGYTQGCFYVASTDGAAEPTYSWVKIGGGHTETVLWQYDPNTMRPGQNITLSDKLTNYDEICFIPYYIADGAFTRAGNSCYFGSQFTGASDSNRIYCSVTGVTAGSAEYCDFKYDGNVTLYFQSLSSNNVLWVYSIIGIKYGSGGGGDGEDSVARAEIAEVEAYIGYNDDTIIGLCADFENDTFTRLAGAVGKSAGADFNVFNMYGGRRLCNLADDGTVNAWYGDDNYTEDGSNGQVMVYQPKFYYKVVPLKLQKNTDYTGAKGYHILKANYYLSDTPKAGFKVHPAFINGNGDEVDGIYISAYEGSIYDTSESEYLKYDSWDVTDNGDDTYTINNYDGHLADVTATTGDKLSSISGVKPASGEFSDLTRPNAEILAANRGAGWHSINIQVAMMEMLLFIVEYGTFNTQTAIANGVVSLANGTHNEGVFTGSTASLGNGSGMAASTSRLVTGATEYSTTTTNGTTSIRYRGVENDWGDLWKHIIGANIWGNGSMGSGEVYINSDYTYADNKHDGNYAGVGFTLANTDGYIKYIGYGNEEFDWVMLCSKTGGSSALPVGDYLYKISNLNGYRTCLLGSSWANGASAGGFSLAAINGLGYRTRRIGSRLLYIPS